MDKENIIGSRFNRLVVISIGKTENNLTALLCKCDCGIVKYFKYHDLKTNKSKSCGCLRSESSKRMASIKRSKINIINQIFGRLKVISEHGVINSKMYYNCACDCGNLFITSGINITTGGTKSCGCIHKEQLIKRSTTHNKSKTRLNNIWFSMRSRCYNSNNTDYHHYGGRGIFVCKEWDDFLTFESWALNNGYGTSLSIDRIDNNKEYCPNNCRWVTAKEQTRNTRKTKLITIDGITKCLTDWALFYNKPYPSVVYIYKRNLKLNIPFDSKSIIGIRSKHTPLD